MYGYRYKEIYKDLNKIDVYDLYKSEYGDGSVWIEYCVGEDFGYELCYNLDINIENFEVEEMFEIDHICNTNKKVNERLSNKPKVFYCSKFLCDLLKVCRKSKKEIVYVDHEYLEKIFKGDEEKKDNFISELKEEVKKVGIEKYINFDYMEYEIVLHKTVITKVLFDI